MLRFWTFSLFVAATLSAQAGERFALSDEISGHPGKTWYDLVKMLVPDLTAAGTGTQQMDLRYVVDLGDSDLPPKALLPIEISDVEVQQIEAEGRALTAVLVDLGEADGWFSHVSALALFDENLSFLDAMNIGKSKINSLDGAPLPISMQDDALLTRSDEDAGDKSYGEYALIMVKDGKLQTIDTVDTVSEAWCGHERLQRLTAEAADAGAGYWPIRLTVTDELKRTDDDQDCGDEVMQSPRTETYSQTYNWSASMGIYIAGDEGFTELNAVNSERY